MVFLWSQCDVPSHPSSIVCALHVMLERDIMVDASWMETLNFSFCKLFLKFSNQIGRARCNHHLACDCPPLCQIWGHLKICLKFGNLNLELFWNLDAPICQNMSMLSWGHPWKYDHACPWSSRLNPTNVWAWYIGHACMLWSMIFENLLRTHCFRSQC